jgi:precorrin-6Y C5,15-methyltransferase (decarboxylating)
MSVEAHDINHETHDEIWLSLIGIGEDGLVGLSPAARESLAQARFVVGGARHLALAGPLEAETMVWPSPIEQALPVILARRSTKVAVLATGDPFFYGIGGLIAAKVPQSEFVCFPAPSAFSLAAARLHWSLQACRLVSLHGRDLTRIIPELQPSAKILCLSSDGTTPLRLARLLCERGLGESRLVVLEAMGGPRERIRAATAATFALESIDALNLVAVEIVAEAGSAIVPIGCGLADTWFETDGQITKREIRALTLSALAPRRGELLWDVGAGSGSVGIEWLLRDPSMRAIAIEPRDDRAARIGRNAFALGVPSLEIVKTRAPAVFEQLPPPDAIFIGGGAGDDGLVEAAFSYLSPSGRLVVNAVTMETEVELVGHHKRYGGELVRLEISRAAPLGGFHAFRPALPVTQWSIRKS